MSSDKQKNINLCANSNNLKTRMKNLIEMNNSITKSQKIKGGNTF